ncbi:hypothetical protein [Vibrio ouci]|uniref:hypothetical protein n=1 Tax=Vibrio ouci TaxID=2499078 RepID=UPI001FC9366B|nr:hypothetical protein [Vibrio ouci]
MKKTTAAALIIGSFAILAILPAIAEESSPDMSDPTAVYTSVGAGYGTKGHNLKLGIQLPDSGEGSAHMISLESKEGGDTYRGRYFKLNTTTGFASSIDANYNRLTGVAQVSAGGLQTIPITDQFTIYPSLYLGTMIANERNDAGDKVGVDFPAITATALLYTKYQFTENVWLNVNPSFTSSVYGSKTDVFDLEASLGYQFTPVLNMRLFHNNNMSVGTYNDDTYESVTRLEFNYAL